MKQALFTGAIIAWMYLIGACGFPSPDKSLVVAAGPRMAMAKQPSTGMDVIGHIGGPGLSVLVQGDYAYIALASELAVVDVSDPQRPQRVGFILIPARQLAAEGDYLYVGGQNGLYVVDVSQPQKPIVVATFATPRPVYGIAVARGFVYLAVDSAGLLVVDFSSPSAPIQVAHFPTSGLAWGVAVADGSVYLTEHMVGLHILDAHDPTTPTEKSLFALPECLYDVTSVGKHVFVTGKTGLHAIDVSDPNQPRLSTTYHGASCPRRVTRGGDHLFLAAENEGMRVIYIDDPTQMVEVGYVDELGLPMDVAVANDYAFVIDGDGGLQRHRHLNAG